MPEKQIPVVSQDPSLTNGNSTNGTFNITQLPEWQLLSGEDVAITPEATQGKIDLDAEKKRTQCSLNCLGYIYEGGEESYAKLTEVQNESVRLTPEQFSGLHEWFTGTLDTPEKLETMQYIMVIHDMGKSGRVYDQMGIDPKSVDHDEVLINLLNDPRYDEQRHNLLPTFSKLPAANQKIVADVLSTRLNYGQFLQAEAPAAVLDGVPEDLDETTRNMYVMHAMLDIAGVVGHVKPDSSIILTSPTYMSMVRAGAALSSTELNGAVERYNAYLGYRAEQFGVNLEGQYALGVMEAKAKVRLGCMLRYASPEQFGPLNDSFDTLPLAVKAILISELNKDGINDRATLPYYGPALLKALTDKEPMDTSLIYFAHVLQEAHIADKAARAAGETGVVTAELGDITRAFNQGNLEIRHGTVRFNKIGSTLIPEFLDSKLGNLDSLTDFEDGETLRGKRILLVGMGGGSDVIQATMLGKIFVEKYGSETAGIVSVRDGEKPLINPGRRISSDTVEITHETEAGSNWRFLEGIPLEGDDAVNPMFILGNTDVKVVKQNISELAKTLNIDVIVGVDTGGDSLYRVTSTAHDKVITTPDQDHAVLEALAIVSAQDVVERVYSVVIAPGVDTPDYALKIMGLADATKVDLAPSDKDLIQRTYAAWHMDGTASEEGRYGKTPFAWLKAIGGTQGLTSLGLPVANVTSATNPWRNFIDITPAMSEIVIMEAVKHHSVIQEV